MRAEPGAERRHKGCPETGRRLLEGVSLPAAVVSEAPLAHNLAWMQHFAQRRGAWLAPHGKTTMAPALFHRQLAAGAWGITLATAPQCRAAFAAGVTRLLLANQLVGEANMAIVADLLEAGAELICLVDSEANAVALDRHFTARGLRLRVLIELGVPGGRCGCRGEDQALALAERIAALPGLSLVGLEGYEGLAGDDGERRVADYLDEMVGVAQALSAAGRFESPTPLITAAGSAWYDRVATAFQALERPFQPVLRPGCYVVHDHGLYAEAQRGVLAREGLDEGLRPALEVFAQVQSLPEPGLAIVAMGRRDVGGDRLPLPLRRYREGGAATEPLTVAGWEVARLMDQHAFVRLPEPLDGEDDVRVGDVRVGDVVAFGISHPCLTFDRWQRVLRVDEALEVQEVMETRF